MENKELIVIPTYNEIESLPIIIERILTQLPQANILVVDDSSPDGTGKWVQDRAKKDNRIFLLSQNGKMGLGKAYVNGFKWGLEKNYKILCQMDADGSHNPEYLPKMLELVQAKKADLVIGSRWIKDGSVENWPKSRELLSRAGNLYIKIMMNLPAKDATAGFRVYSTELLNKMDLDSVSSKGFSFQIDMTARAKKANGIVMEYPIRFEQRMQGESKMSGGIIIEALAYVTSQGIKNRFKKS